MQYTGLKDKNGKEIYEGDIEKDGGPITFWNGGYWVKMSERGHRSITYYCEIIGNIYETPDLVKGAK